ncbi:TadE/TadG family type IV pilus assembly protein [Leekyejoonella antrihumi]|uniref:Pilus assembly protein n=1 Tax=Leekyejoonella antrihumi TaxID=1660198 RepID=A0A563DW72_9MICO|nr:pilus assembly protein [Leekyejoonella antrihumi]TWP34456.1 pilus assembly protein [Leekyejoonella antrihumi]
MTVHRLSRDEDGFAAIEVAILTPALLLMFALVVVAGRVMVAANAAGAVSGPAARSASLALTPGAAQGAAAARAARTLAAQHLICVGGPQVSVDTSAWTGHPGVVRVTITCQVRLSDVGAPGLPGTRTITSTAISPVDPWRTQP